MHMILYIVVAQKWIYGFIRWLYGDMVLNGVVENILKIGVDIGIVV